MNKSINIHYASDIKTEEQLNRLLEICGFSSQSPKDIDWLSHWWEKEFEPNSHPLARQIEVVRDENIKANLCVAVEKGLFIIYMFNERDYWFDSLGELEGFSSANEFNEYLKGLVNQYIYNWKNG